MNEKFQPGDEMSDDVAGHGLRGNVAGDDQDVEGHMPRVRIALPEEADDEGGNVEDTEGHGTRFKGALPDDDSDGDDTEGHGIRVRF